MFRRTSSRGDRSRRAAVDFVVITVRRDFVFCRFFSFETQTACYKYEAVLASFTSLLVICIVYRIDVGWVVGWFVEFGWVDEFHYLLS